MKKHIYFIEDVNSHLDTESKKGAFSHFIYTAVVITESDFVKAKELRTFISNKFWEGSPLKSSKIEINKRLQIIETYKNVDFEVFNLIIDKGKIKNKHLENKTVFHKVLKIIFGYLNKYLISLALN